MITWDFVHTLTSFCLPQEEIGFNMKILDIGGGFSASDTPLELVSEFHTHHTGREMCNDMDFSLYIYSASPQCHLYCTALNCIFFLNDGDKEITVSYEIQCITYQIVPCEIFWFCCTAIAHTVVGVFRCSSTWLMPLFRGCRWDWL